MTSYKCAHPECPGYSFRASDRPHPPDTCTDEGRARVLEVARRLTATQRRRLQNIVETPEGVPWNVSPGSHCALEQMGLVICLPRVRMGRLRHFAVPDPRGRAVARALCDRRSAQ